MRFLRAEENREDIVGIFRTVTYLQKILLEAYQKAFPFLEPIPIPVHRSPRLSCGGFSTTLPFLCGKLAGVSPAQASDRLWAQLPARDAVFAQFEKAGGYLNCSLTPQWYSRSFAWILQQQPHFSPSLTEEDLLFTNDRRIRRIDDALVRLCSCVRHCIAENLLQIPLPSRAADALSSPQDQLLIFYLCRLLEADGQSLLPVLEDTAAAVEDFKSKIPVLSRDKLQTAGRSALCLSAAFWMQQSMEKLEDGTDLKFFK